MRLMLKMIFRNIMVKPLRTVIIVLCLAAVSLTFSLCLTVNEASRAAVDEQIRRATGRSDFTVSSKNGFDALPELPENTDSICAVLVGSYLQIHSIDNYKYVQKRSVEVLGIDTKEAEKFGILPTCISPASGEAVISYAIAQRFGYEVGDSLTLPCADKTELTLTVVEIAMNNKLLSVSPLTVIVSPDTAKAVLSRPDTFANVIYIDAQNVQETAEFLREAYPEYDVHQLTGTVEIEEMIRRLTRTFFIIFAITLLMILFIISAFSKNIAAQRLAVIGTLRSIGAEKTTAALTLLSECALYGMLGGVLGTALFYALKDVLLGNMLPRAGGMGGSVHAPFYIPMIGLVLSAAVSILVSFFSVVRTSKMSVKNIIFGGKDTVFRPSGAGTITGAALIIGAIMLYLSKLGFFAYIIGLAAFVTGICLVIPKLLSGISALTAKHTKGSKMPVFRLALIQSGTKKTAVTGTMICSAAAMLTAALYVLSCSAQRLYSVKYYSSDVIISSLCERADRYSFITAEKKEFIYSTSEIAEINGTQTDVTFFGFDGFEMFSGITELPTKLSDNEIAFDKLMMKRLGICEGDHVTLTFKQNTVRPVTLRLTAVSGIDSIYYDQRCNSALISLETYKSVYHDHPSMLLANGDSELIRRQLVDEQAELETSAEYYKRSAEESKSITSLLFALAAMGILLGVICVSGEQTIGFEQRKHEFAVLRAQGMSIAQLSKMLVIETAVSAFMPLIISMCAGRFVLMLITKTLASLDMNIPISFGKMGLMMFVSVVQAAVMLTALIPILSLRKMKTANDLKCE